MSNNVLNKEDLINLLHEKTGFYKKHMSEVADALEEIILESLQAATFERDSELRLAPGVLICGKRKKAGEAKDPRTGDTIMSPEKVIPYATFKQSIRLKLYKKPKGYKKKNKKG
jgi:nucleoid DNA-binding protein